MTSKIGMIGVVNPARMLLVKKMKTMQEIEIDIPNPMKNPFLHDITNIQKIEKDIDSTSKNHAFKKKITSKPRRKHS